MRARTDFGGGAVSDDGPFCPECGEPVSATADYCMHCYADFPPDFPADGTTDEPSYGGSDEDGWGDSGDDHVAGSEAQSSEVAGATEGQLLDPDGFVDDTLTVIVGAAGGLVVGVVATFVLLFATGSAWTLPLGFVAWLLATGYLVRARTVQGAVANTGYAVAAVLLAIPLIAASPLFEDATLADRAVMFGTTLVVVAVPAALAAGVGWIAGQFVDDPGSEG